MRNGEIYLLDSVDCPSQQEVVDRWWSIIHTEIWISMLQRSLTLQKFGFLCYRSHWPYRNLDFYATEVIDPYRNLDFYASDLGQKVYKSCGWTQSFSCPATVQGVTPLPSMEESHNMYILHVHCTLYMYIVHCTLYMLHSLYTVLLNATCIIRGLHMVETVWPNAGLGSTCIIIVGFGVLLSYDPCTQAGHLGVNQVELAWLL